MAEHVSVSHAISKSCNVSHVLCHLRLFPNTGYFYLFRVTWPRREVVQWILWFKHSERVCVVIICWQR